MSRKTHLRQGLFWLACLRLLLGKAECTVALPAKQVSHNLLAAQEKLAQLRQAARANRLASGLPVDQWGQPVAQPTPLPLTAVVAQLPTHLGWHSTAVTRLVRQQTATPAPQLAITPTTADTAPATEPIDPPTNQPPVSHVKLYPDLAIAMLGQAQVAAGRIWLLLRHLDSHGRGWLTLADVKSWLSQRPSPWRVCGWRQLRNLLHHGQGVFWQQTNGRVWLYSVARVAAALKVGRLQFAPVALPVQLLTERIGQVRAHFYASFHSSRNPKKVAQRAAPIARQTIAHLTHIQPRTQRRYEKMARVVSDSHFAIGTKATAVTIEQTSWQRGSATFQLKDKKGLQGAKNETYMAWQLPNSYQGPHAAQPKGHQKRINQALSDLFMQGMTGNGHGRYERCFYAHGATAAATYNRGTDHDIYWYDGRCRLWYFFAATTGKK